MIPSSYFSSTAKANKKSGGPPIPSTLWLQVCHGPPIINPTKTKKTYGVPQDKKKWEIYQIIWIVNGP
jgi:hypothetical protein